MQKGNKGLNITVILAFLTALSIVCGKYLAIRGGDVMRFSIENMPIIFAGMCFGPIAGGAVGLVADLVGCVLVGYTINPVVTLGAAAIGVVSGACSLLLQRTNLKPWIITIVSVASAHLIGSVIIKTAGLSVFYSMPFHILLLWRALNYLIVGIIDGFAVHILKNNKEIKAQIKKLGGNKV